MATTTPEQFLRNAVDRGSAMVLTLPSGGMVRHYKSRFLGLDPAGIWVEADACENGLLAALLADGKPVGCSCKLGPEKLKFVSPIVRVEPAFVVMPGTNVFAILIKHPAHVVLQQRRNDYRVRLTPDDEVTAQVWQIAEHVYLSDRPPAKQLLGIELRDLSIGGVGFVAVPKHGEPPRVAEGVRLRVNLSTQGSSMLVEARVVFAMADDATLKVQCGAAFAHLERDVEGRQKLAWLAKVVGQLQREEVRRMRRAAG